MSGLEHDKWVGTTYGNGWMHRWLIRFLRVIDVRLLYAFARVFVVPPTLVVNKSARTAIYRYLRRRHGMGRPKAAWFTFRNYCDFSEVVIDRFAMYAGKKFDIVIDNYEQFRQLSEGESGFIQLSSHIGNYELAGYSLVAEKKRINALVFAGEKESVMVNRQKMFQANNIGMIPMSGDMSHLFAIDAALSAGEILSMPADRVFGSQKSFEVEILGAKTSLPQGPFILAAMRHVPLLFVAVMKDKATKYHIHVHRIDSDQTDTASVKQRALTLAQAYALQLEGILRQYPTQWYNYFDFWTRQ